MNWLIGGAIVIGVLMFSVSTGFDFSFNSCVEIILKKEGGYVNHPKDPGGETNFGISKRAYPSVDIKNLTREEAKAIYKRDYWDKLKLQEPALNLIAFDCAVNQGVSVANSYLDKCKQLSTLQEKIDFFYDKRASRYAVNANAETFLKGWIARLDDIYDQTMKALGG